MRLYHSRGRSRTATPHAALSFAARFGDDGVLAVSVSPRTSSGYTLWVAAWFGLLTGFGEIALLGLKKFYLGQFIRFGPEVAWMAPLSDVCLFLLAGTILFAIRRRSPAQAVPGLTVGVLAFLAVLSLLLMYYPLHLYAKLLLAAGLAVQTVRLIGRWPVGFERLVRRSTPWMMALVGIIAIGVGSWRWMTYRQTLARLPSARAGAPNVLLVVLDTVRAQNLSLYGYGRSTTPNLEQWAKTGIVFDKAIASAPWTLPSHASMFTGRWPHELSTDWEMPLDASYPTLAEVLARHGYVTAGFAANTYYCGYELGLARGFAHYEDYVVSLREILVSSSLARSVLNSSRFRRLIGYYDNIPRRNAAQINDHFLTWVSSTQHRPFFAFLNYFDAHETYLPPRPFKEKFGPDLPRSNGHLSQELRRSLRDDWHSRPPAEIKTEMDMYDGAIAYVDDQLGRLFHQLQARGLLDNTVVIVTSDHGEQFGEHGLFLHSSSLYQPLIHVPLVISFPGRLPEGRRVATVVSLRDLAATISDLIGLADGGSFPGQSLARFWIREDQSASRVSDPVLSEVRHADWAKTWFPWYPTAKGDMQSLDDNQYHYVRNGDGREELYALEQDPGEEHDLAHLSGSREALERFRMALRRILEDSPPARPASPKR